MDLNWEASGLLATQRIPERPQREQGESATAVCGFCNCTPEGPMTTSQTLV